MRMASPHCDCACAAVGVLPTGTSGRTPHTAYSCKPALSDCRHSPAHCPEHHFRYKTSGMVGNVEGRQSCGIVFVFSYTEHTTQIMCGLAYRLHCIHVNSQQLDWTTIKYQYMYLCV